MSEYKDYIPAGSLEVNEKKEDFVDFVPEPKPELVEVSEPVPAEDENLSVMTKKELIGYAKESGIKVTSKMAKDEILSAIEAEE